jgi:hypothetical protein
MLTAGFEPALLFEPGNSFPGLRLFRPCPEGKRTAMGQVKEEKETVVEV